MAINWARGYTSDWQLRRVNESTWGDADEVFYLDSVSPSADGTDTVPKLQTATMKLTLGSGQELEPGTYRIVMNASATDGETERVPVMTLMFEQSSGTHDYGVETVSAKGESVLKPLSKTLMSAGTWIAAGEDAVAWCADVISRYAHAPIYVQGSFALGDPYVWDAGTSYLKAIWQVLDAGGHVLSLDGEGNITIKPLPTTPIFSIDSSSDMYLMPTVDYDRDYSEVPNVYYAVETGHMVQVVNDNPESVTSTVTRGYEVSHYDDDVMKRDGESLEDYANRKLEELSTVEKTYKCQMEYRPGIQPFELIEFDKPGIVQDVLRIKSYSIDTAHGLLYDLELAQEMRLWQSSLLY